MSSIEEAQPNLFKTGMRIVDREIVACLIFSKDGKLFQGMKDPAGGGVYPHCWHIPGGGVENGETKLTALIREIKEETGLDISAYSIHPVDYDGQGLTEKTIRETGEKVLVRMKFNVYRVSIDDKNADEIEVRLDDDLIKHLWTDLAELRSLKLTPPSVELFTKLGYL